VRTAPIAGNGPQRATAIIGLVLNGFPPSARNTLATGVVALAGALHNRAF